MRIGEVAASAEIPPETVRFYERRGLLAEPCRAGNGYREYDEAALSQLRFIRTAQTAGLTLAEIRSVIVLRNEGTAPCSHVEALLSGKLAEVRDRQKRLAALEHELEHLIERSATLDPADCMPDDVCHVLPSDRTPPSRRAGIRDHAARKHSAAQWITTMTGGVD
jgi:DNA-binding transcriptional MerR regulator